MMTELRQRGYAEVNGTTLYYEVSGNGPALVLNHGGLVDHHLWDDQVTALARDFTIINYDIRGFGQSGLITADTAPYSMEDDLYYLLRFLEVEKAVVMGLSMGGTLSVDFTLQHPEMVEALILVGSGLNGFEGEAEDEALKAKFAGMEEAYQSGNIVRAVELSLQVWTDGPSRTPDQVDAQVRERIQAMTMHNFLRGDDDMQPQQMQPPAIGRLSEIQVPTLIMVGELDVEFIKTAAGLLEKGIAGSRKVVIPNTAHHPNIEKPAEINHAIMEFLQGLRDSQH